MREGDGTRVAVVMGGICGERDVSLRTGACVVAHLADRYRVKPVEIHRDGAWSVPRGFVGDELAASRDEWFRGERQSALDALGRLRSDGVVALVNALHGPGGEDGTIQGLWRNAGFAFTGPDVAPAAVTMDKRLTKLVLRGSGIPTPIGFEFPVGRGTERLEWPRWAEARAAEVEFPWIVKPICLGSSVGVERFANVDEFLARAREVGDELWRPRPELAGSGSIVERVVQGRELTCGVLEADGPPRALAPIEIRPRRSAFFDYDAKYTPGASEEICPAPLSPALTRAVEELAVRVHSILECAPLSRTDIFLVERDPVMADRESIRRSTPDATAGGEPFELVVLEINTLPGMTETSLIPQSAKHEGIELATLFDALVRHALRREGARDNLGRL